MKAIVDKSGCIACQFCVGVCPEVFHMGADELAEGGEIPAANLAAAKEARDGCPVSVISIEE